MKINTAFEFNNGYALSSCNFGLCAKPVDGVVMSLRGPSISCREKLCFQVAVCINDQQQYRYTTFNTDRLRLLTYSKSDDPTKEGIGAHIERAKRSIRLINSLEKNVGWPLTKHYRITENVSPGRPRKIGKTDVLYMVVGNVKWLRSPVMISMYSILLRSTARNIINEETITSSKDCFPRIVRSLRGKWPHNKEDYLINAIVHAIPVLTKFNALFNERSLAFNYSGERLGGMNAGTEGLQKLVTGSTRDADLRARFIKYVVPLVK